MWRSLFFKDDGVFKKGLNTTAYLIATHFVLFSYSTIRISLALT